MKYKILKDYVNWNRDIIKAGGTVELGETPATSFYGALLANGFIKEIEEGEFRINDEYYYVDCCGLTAEGYWCDDEIDKFRLSQGNAFHTEEEAEKYLEYLKAKAVLRAEAMPWDELDGSKRYVFRAVEDGTLYPSYGCNLAYNGQFYFPSKADAEASIKNHEKEWRIVFDYEREHGA